LHAADGRTLWTRDFPSKPLGQHPDNNWASSTPCADGDGVILLWTTAESVLLVALDPDGRELWRRDLGPFVGERGAGTSPIIVDDMVILANDQEDPNLLPENRERPDPTRVAGKSFVIALERRTGATRWKTDRRTGIAAYSTPCLYRDGDRTELLLTSTGHGMTAVDPATGKVNWEVPDVFPDRCVASPVFCPGMVFAGYGFGVRGTKFLAVRPGTPANGFRPEVAYEVEKSLPVVPTPLAKGDRLFLWSDDGIVTDLEAATGREIWRERIGGWYFASPVCLGDRLFGVSKEGEVVVLAASDRFEVLGCSPLGEPCYATPAVGGDAMYFRTRSHLIALGVKKP
jgi:outer membrane protein assembly factor BamB